MKIFLTGATGFVGQALLRRLFHTGADIKILVRPSSDVTPLMGKNIDVVEGDLRDADLIARAVKGCQQVYHAAGYHSFCGHRDQFEQTNREGTLNLLRASVDAGVERVVYTSTVAAVGAAQGGGLADEETQWNLGDVRLPYVQTKRKAEVEALEFAEGKLDLVVVNPTAAVGPNDRKPSPLGRWIVRYLRGHAFFVPNVQLNLTDVDSVAEGHLLAMEKGKPGTRYILGGTNTTSREYFSLLSGLTGLRRPWPTPWLLSYLNGIVGQYLIGGLFRRPCATNLATVRLLHKKLHYSSDKAKNELGWSPGSLEDASVRTIDWFCRNGYVKRRRAKAILAHLDQRNEN